MDLINIDFELLSNKNKLKKTGNSNKKQKKDISLNDIMIDILEMSVPEKNRVIS